LTRRTSCVYSALLRRVFRPAAFFRALRYLGAGSGQTPRGGRIISRKQGFSRVLS
jgi:hypothetical protein